MSTFVLSAVRRDVPSRAPAWERPAFIGLLAATSVLYVWGLSASGWANSFYSAAVQAGAHSWKAFFFGSSDAANFITVDKTPLALWPMDLAARLFGVNSWSILLPQALMGVATVGVLYATVRRSLLTLGPRAAAGGALLAGAVLATTPVAALMFRFNNPDAMLVLLLTLGAYALVRAQERASTRWLLLAAAFVGLAFLAKMLQAFLVVPAFASVYLVMAPTGLRHRLWQLALATAAMVVSAGWWVAIVAAVPAHSRPYIGGSQHNSVLELTLGYNGLGRLNGNETGGLGNTNQDAGWTRMFGPELGGQIGWLLPAALVLLVAGIWATSARHRRIQTSEPRPGDPVATGLHATAPEPGAERRVSQASHTGLGPADTAPPTTEPREARLAQALRSGPGLIDATLGVPPTAEPDSAHTVPRETDPGWALRTESRPTDTTDAAPATEPDPTHAAPRETHPSPALRTDPGLAGFALWGGWLLVTDAVFSLMRGIFHAYYTVALAPAVAALVGMGAAVLWASATGRQQGDGDRDSKARSADRRHRTAATIVLAAVIALTAWWSYRLLGRTSSFEPWLRIPILAGGLVAAGALLAGRWPAGRWLTGRALAVGAALAVAASLAGPAAYAIDTAATTHRGAIPSAGPSAGRGGMRGPGGFPGGARGGFGGPPGGGAGQGGGGAGQGGMPQPPNGRFRPPGQNPGTGGAGPGGGGMRGGGMGGPGALLDASTPSAALTALLKQKAGSYTWAAATVGSNTAAGYQLATGKPIMAIGGFNGTDPAPSLAQFQQYVRAGKIHYFVTGSTARGRGGSGSGDAQQITAWVAQTFPTRTVDGTTVYDLG